MEWLIVGGLILLYLVSQKKQVEPASPLVSSVSPVSPVSSKPLEGSMQEIAQIQEDKPPQENFLENPALRMMGNQVLTQIKNVVLTGSMQAPMDIGSALMTMFSGDIQEGGQIGQLVGTLAAPVVSSLVSEVGVSGVSTLAGETIPFVGEAGEAAAVGVMGTFSTLAFPLAFTGMVLGEMIGGAFEESSPFSKAQQAVIAQWEASGSSRARFLNQKGFTDQQIIKWVADHPDFHYWYAICPWPIPGRAVQADGTYLRIDQRVVLQGLYSQEERDWLDNFVKDLGLGYIEIVGGEATGISSVERTYADVEGYLGGWHQDYVSLDDQTQKFRQTPTQA